jgi:hypothetical protein
MAELTLRSGTDNNLAHVNIGRLLDRERNRARDRLGRQRELVSCAFALGEQECSRLAYPAACAGDYDDLAFYIVFHGVKFLIVFTQIAYFI